MRYASIGIPAALPSKRPEADKRKAGFTLIEALVALSLIVAFAAVLGPLLFQARHILIQGDGQIRAQILLRSLLEAPFDRADPEPGVREGESTGMRWRLTVEPIVPDASIFEPDPSGSGKDQQPNWALYRVTARVFWGARQVVTAETLRLGTGE